MEMNVPDEFLAFIEEVDEPTCGGVAVALIKWAATNQKEAIRISREYHKLGHNAKSHFGRSERETPHRLRGGGKRTFK